MNVQSRQWLPLLAATFLVLSANPALAQKKPVAVTPIGMPQDWSHRHVVYSHPDTPEEAAKKGQTAKWRKNYRDPRFVMALSRRLESQEAAKTPVLQPLPRLKPGRNKPTLPAAESGIHRDWSHVLGGNGGLGRQGVYPAKYSFDIYATPSCANDFVVYGTNTGGVTEVPNGTNNDRRSLTFGGDAGNGNTVTLGTVGTSRSVVLTASATLNTGQNFQNITDNATRATNLAAAANRWSHQTGLTATSAGAVVTFRRNTFGAIATIAIASTLNNETVSANTNGLGTAGQPTIMAFNQLYAPCNNDDPKQPRVMWSYNTGAGAVVETSPVLSYYDADGGGKQVAFVQRTGTTASLVLLRWSSASPGTAGAPTIPTVAASAADYRNFATPGGCTATPCMLVLPFADSNGNGNHNSLDNRTSSPYVDYTNDVIWVGDADGFLHKFTGVFVGTPAEVDDATFPVEVSNGDDLSSPVVDFGTGQVFVGSASDNGGGGGRLHRVDSTTGAVVSSAKLTINTNNLGILASPIVDSSAGRAYVFVYAGNGGTGANCTIATCRAVVQFNTAFAAANAGTSAIVGAGADNAGQQYMGTFDDAYYSSATPDGALYVVGGDITQQWVSVLWKIPIVNNVMGTPIRGATISGNDLTAGSYTGPLTEVKNGVNDYLYVGVHDYATDGTATVCGTGLVGSACLYMFNLSDLNGTAPGTGAAWGTANVPSAGLIVFGGTGGIIVDNISTDPGTSQIYFSNLNTSGNAFQVSQDGLQ